MCHLPVAINKTVQKDVEANNVHASWRVHTAALIASDAMPFQFRYLSFELLFRPTLQRDVLGGSIDSSRCLTTPAIAGILLSLAL